MKQSIKIEKNNNDKLNNANLVNTYLVFTISDFTDETDINKLIDEL